MCLIITLVMLVLAIQSLLSHQWLAGTVQLLIALGFMILLIRNIRITHCERQGNCDNFCMLPDWLTKLFRKKEK
ncbi:hypothetical protein [Sulfurovum sp.]|uniref:hypothetical protein n=1 Tax=Sulfurovum sp. TaxID=1969726 RepID=UPI002A358E97|nr:hypothetical protein [Sulfurovum sp.]MDD2451722.1 hypothetical protein [Sulfurovum sp.]MDD3500219.1 hypothetical protein [Sulfurovum sp.]MDY0402484.1 hypothetical protein [Sulfurovum sp.]